MPQWNNPDSGYRAWVDSEDQSIYLEWNGRPSEWVCNRCGGVVNELPAQTFEFRAGKHTEGHRP